MSEKENTEHRLSVLETHQLNVCKKMDRIADKIDKVTDSVSDLNSLSSKLLEGFKNIKWLNTIIIGIFIAFIGFTGTQVIPNVYSNTKVLNNISNEITKNQQISQNNALKIENLDGRIPKITIEKDDIYRGKVVDPRTGDTYWWRKNQTVAKEESLRIKPSNGKMRLKE